MAKLVLTDAHISVGKVNLSDHCSQITIKDEADAVDMTAFNKRGYKIYDQGLKDAASPQPSSPTSNQTASTPSSNPPTNPATPSA